MRHASGPLSALARLKKTSTNLLKPGVVAARSKFYITIVMLSVTTYATAFVAYWLVRSRKDDTIAETAPDPEEHLEEGKNEKVFVEGGKSSRVPKKSKSGDNARNGIFKRRNVGKKKQVISDSTQV